MSSKNKTIVRYEADTQNNQMVCHKLSENGGNYVNAKGKSFDQCAMQSLHQSSEAAYSELNAVFLAAIEKRKAKKLH